MPEHPAENEEGTWPFLGTHDAGVADAVAATPDAAPVAQKPLPDDPAEWLMMGGLGGDQRAETALQNLPHDELPCNANGLECRVEQSPRLEADAPGPRKGGTGTIRGMVARDFVSGMIGNSGSHTLLDGCEVTAIGDGGATYTAKVTKGRYALRVPAGRYQVVLDACFKCVVRYHPKLPWLAVKASGAATASATCTMMGQ